MTIFIIFTGSRRIHAKFIIGDFQVILSLSRTIYGCNI